MKISAIYKIQSAIKPERFYIGSSCNVYHRWNQHISDLRNNEHHSQKLQRHFNKYGEADISFSILLGCDECDLIKTEQYFLDSYKPYFNNRMLADSNRGIKRTEEVKKKLSLIKTGKKTQPHSDETKKKIGEAHRGKIITAAQKEKMSAAKKGKTPWNKGIKYSDEYREKLRISHVGMTGKKHKPETIEKIRESNKNKKHRRRTA